LKEKEIHLKDKNKELKELKMMSLLSDAGEPPLATHPLLYDVEGASREANLNEPQEKEKEEEEEGEDHRLLLLKAELDAKMEEAEAGGLASEELAAQLEQKNKAYESLEVNYDELNQAANMAAKMIERYNGSIGALSQANYNYNYNYNHNHNHKTDWIL